VSARTEAAVYGAVVGLGAALVLDNVVVHWLVGLHRVVQGGAG
jgi:hypothetical protein